MIENLPAGGAVRKEGRIVPVPAGWRTRSIDFGRGPQLGITIPWGDVSTAFHTTGIPDIEVYLAAPTGMRLGVKATRILGPILGTGVVQRALIGRVRSGAPGPSDGQRARAASYIWGEAATKGRTVVSRLKTPEGYTLTVLSSLLIAQKVLKGEAPAGFQTPARAYGPDLVMEIEGVTRTDDPEAPA